MRLKLVWWGKCHFKTVCCLLLMCPTCSCGCRWQYWASYWQYLTPVHLVLRSNSGFCVYFFRRLNIRCTKCQSSSLTWLFFPGHRRSPIFCGKRSHLIFAGLCILSRPVPGHRHFQDFGWRNCFSRRACLAVQSEHTIFAFLFESIYFRRASYGNFRCPRSPHSSQRYGLMSLGNMPLLSGILCTLACVCGIGHVRECLLRAHLLRASCGKHHMSIAVYSFGTAYTLRNLHESREYLSACDIPHRCGS